MATSRWFTSIDTPLGAMHALADDHALAALTFDASPDRPPYADARRDDAHPLLVAVRAQLRAFFDGALVAFDLPLAPAGTAFDREVWRALCTIPYGATWSYRELAQAIGRPTAMRAVGAANGRNPIAIAIPCHRVIGADGTLTGYAGGLPRKRALLALEARVQPPRHDLLALARE